jgi:16S rRNA (guanine527-N7)-methyltransferase
MAESNEKVGLGELRQASDALGLALPETALERLLVYRDLLIRWNRVYNLTALRDPQEMLSHHLVDCLAVVEPLRRHLAGRTEAALARPVRVVDVGSGGGLPGAVLALVQPGWQVLCVDSVAKKAAFIRQVAAELGLPNLGTWHGQVQQLRGGPGHDVVVSRAFASLADFVGWTRHLLADDGVWMAMKGRAPDAEIGELPPDVEMFHVEPLHPPGLDAERCLVWMRRR